MGRRAERFDDQAWGFDRRAGIGVEVGRAVAEAVLELASAAPGDLVLEIGAGTGEIGWHLGSAARYVGVDSSRPMLEVFRSKLPDGPGSGRAGLVQSDADQAWPVQDGVVAAALASRVAHLLDPDHVAAEVRRVCRPGGVFLVGRVRRDPGSPQSRLRSKREALLRDRGLAPLGGVRATERLLARLAASGATRLEERTVAGWTAARSPGEVLAAWEGVPTMGGIELPPALRAAILDDLREWARHELGDLGQTYEFPERYTLDGVRLGSVLNHRLSG